MRNDFESNYLMHHGIYGQKWGIRRYQNPDGSLTEAGRKRYGVGSGEGVNDIRSEKGTKRRIKDVKKSIAKNNKARGKEYSKIANNPENFLGLNKKHGKKIEEYSENIKKGEEELKRLFAMKDAIDYDKRTKWDEWDEQKSDDLHRKAALARSKDGAVIEAEAREAARKAGLDQGDNWKVYRDAQAGDKKSQEVVKKWEKDKKEAEKLSKKTGYGFKTTKEAYEAAKLREGKNLINKAAGDEYMSDTGKRDREIINKYSKKYDGKKISDDDLMNNYSKHNSEKISSSSEKSSGLSEKAIKSRVEYAKNTGMFDMEFLERIDRYVDEENHSQAEVLKGYEKYLKEHGDEFYKKK